MLQRANIFCLIFVMSLLPMLIGSIATRVITTQLNPGCDIPECKQGYNGTFPNLLHVVATGPRDTLQYVVSSIGAVTAVVARFDRRARLTVDWRRLLSTNATEFSTSVRFDRKPLETFAVVFTKLIEYRDQDDTADMTSLPVNYTDIKALNFENLNWRDSRDFAETTANSVVFETAVDDDLFFENGSISLKFVFPPTEARMTELPHLLFNGNGSTIDFVVDRYRSSFKNARIAVEFAHVTAETSEPLSYEIDQSIDDEFTPGIFKTVAMTTAGDRRANGSYLQWKPVCYLKPGRAMKVATSVREYDLRNVTSRDDAFLDRSIASAIYGAKMADYAIRATNVSFGLSEDGYYTGTNYTAWTLTTGYGTRPTEALSVLVISVISVGLGIPVALIVFGGIGVCVKKRRAKLSSSYREIGSNSVST
ncbi:glycosylated lysosomal membrane protein B-like [Tubulanus polymorphus]|uniref:glycosylated lysosomal membrane protein B-like n=1 Tax=Tubulanus polymorphus TaxID=672921 RepID=UPI003DA36A6D